MCIRSVRQTEKARRQLNQIRTLLDEMDVVNCLEEPDRYRELCEEMVMSGEKMTCDLRHFALTFSDETASMLMGKSVGTLGITVQKKDEVIEIELPFLLPKKKHKNSDFLKEPLRYALKKAAEKYDLKIQERALICFVHGYDEEGKLYKIRDYDNEEAKPILDCIALEILIDDSARYCDVYHTIRLAKGEKTMIYVMPARVAAEAFTRGIL